ncbi:MAG TPA: phage major capsid protein [Gallionellaceae bacterium]|nr:phage major capsid protein [Gallionellaceae bacterium]
MQLKRTIAAGAKRAAGDDNLIDLAISSEAPYERWFGIEILSHDAASVDMTRIADGRHPLLLNHCTDDQIGVIKEATLDSDRILRGRAKFSQSQLGQEILQDVVDGIRELVSVGYLIDEIVEVEPAEETNQVEYSGWRTVRKLSGDEFEREMRSKHGEHYFRSGQAAARANGDEPPTFLVTRWTPFEASIVPVPADVTVGIGRSAGAENDPAPEAPAATKETPPIIILEKKKMPDPIQKTPAELEIERRDGIQSLAEQYAKYLEAKDGPDAVRKGMSIEMFKDYIIARMESRHTDTSNLHIGMGAKEIKRYSLGRALVASITGNWKEAGLELECSRAVESIMGRSPEGFFVPFETFNRDFNVGTASEAGNLVATNLRTDMYTDALRANMVMGKLGVTMLAGLTGNLDLPRKSTAGTLGMLTEIGSASETAPVTAKATLSPKRVGAYTQVSKQALLQSAMALENMIRDDLVTGAAVLLENQCINGAGTAAEIKGLRNVVGIGTVTGGTNGIAPAWSHIVDLESACANSNAEPDRLSGYLLNTKLRGKLKQTQFATNLPFIWQNGDMPLNGYRAAVTNNVPSNLTKGTSTTVCSSALFASDWSMAVIGLFGAPDITVDPYTLAATGQVQITLNQFADLQHRQPAALAKVDDLLAG